jgi:hypothetical protein
MESQCSSPTISTYFYIAGWDLDPAACTSAIGLEPSEIWRQKREELKRRDDLPSVSWNIGHERRESHSVSEAVDTVLDLVWPARDRVKAFVLGKGLEVGVACTGTIQRDRPVYDLSPNWTSPGKEDSSEPHFEALSKASGLTLEPVSAPPRLARRFDAMGNYSHLSSTGEPDHAECRQYGAVLQRAKRRKGATELQGVVRERRTGDVEQGDCVQKRGRCDLSQLTGVARPDWVLQAEGQRGSGRDGVSYGSVQEAIRNGTRTFDPATGKAVYDLPASASSTGRAVRVIRNDVTGNIVSVIDRGSR